MIKVDEAELILIVAEGCNSCKVAEEMLKEEAEVLDLLHDDRGTDIAAALDLKSVPTLVVYDRESRRMCSLDKKGVPERCVAYEDGI